MLYLFYAQEQKNINEHFLTESRRGIWESEMHSTGLYHKTSSYLKVRLMKHLS